MRKIIANILISIMIVQFLVVGIGNENIDRSLETISENVDETSARDVNCTSFNGMGGLLWDPVVNVSTGDVYEYPANSGAFYQVVIQGYTNQSLSLIHI